MAFIVEHPWLSAAAAVGIGFGITAAVFGLDAWAVRRRRDRRRRAPGYLIGGNR